VKNALHSVAYNPQSQRHIRILVATENQDGGGRYDEREVPENIQDYHGLRIGPIALSFFQLFRRRLPHHHRRLAHQAAAARLPQEARRLAEARAAEETAAGGRVIGRSAEEWRRIGAFLERIIR